VYLDVKGHGKALEESENYVYLTGYLPQPVAAKEGQYLRIAAVDACGKVTAVETAAVEAMPGYVRSEAERLAEVVQSRQSGETLTLLACADLHHSAVHSYAARMAESITHAGQAMGILRQQVHLDGAAMLGDLVWDGGETAQEALGAMRFVNGAIADGFSGLPNFRTRGNHDCVAKAEDGLTDGQIFANIGAYNTGAVYDPENRTGGYCYRDFGEQKIRVVCINTSEDDAGAMAVSAAQNAWLQSALAVEDGWGVVLLSHHPLDWNGSGSNVMATVKAASNILCNVHGHTHCYAVGTLAGTEIPRIAVPNVCFYRSNEYGQNGTTENAEGIEFGEEVTYDKSAGTAADTAFCVITIDRAAGKIYADHYGAGYDRVIALGEAERYGVSYQLTNVTSSNEATEVTEGASFVAELTAAEGFAISSVVVTMGGADVTEAVYADGVVSIPSVTGAISITAVAKAAAPSYTNLVPMALDYDLEGVFNGQGYMDGAYISTTSPYYTAATDGTVATGLIPYDIYGDDRGYNFQPATIYIKGITFDESNSHNRLGVFVEEGEMNTGGTGTKFMYTTLKVSQLPTYFTVETLGEQYYKLTPLMVEETGRNKLASTWITTTNVSHIAISGNGSGDNLIITFDEPIA